MKIFNQKGTKERLVEMFQKVNKLKLNENSFELGKINILEEIFNKFKSNQLDIDNIETSNEEVDILAHDNDGNYEFKFILDANELEVDDVYKFNSVKLINFKLNSKSDNIEIDKNSLNDFNNKHKSELIDIISTYVDVDDELDIDETYDDIAKKIDSMPFGYHSNDIQTSINYGDRKPVNGDLRVDNSKPDKYVPVTENDEIQNDVESDDEALTGGLGDGAEPINFNPSQIIRGIEVEMEHTNDPKVALEIAMDHLTEDPEYYTKHDECIENGEFSSEDDVMRDKLLGYKPRNVGEY